MQALIFLILCSHDSGVFRVHEIEIQNHNIFETRGFPGNLISWLHIPTTESTIRGLLTFREGDIVNTEVLEENERRIRGMGIFNRVWIERLREGDTTIVWVGTWDLWSTSVYLDLSREGGIQRFGLGLAEHNFLGMAKEVSAIYQKDYERNYWEARYNDMNFLNRGLEAEISAQLKSDGQLAKVGVNKPFRVVEEVWSWGVSGGMDSSSLHTYYEGNTVDSENFCIWQAGARFSRNLSRDRILAPFFDIKYWRRTGLDTVAMRGVGIGLRYERRNYFKTKKLDGFGYDEDFLIGPMMTMGSWAYIEGWGAELGLSAGWHIGERFFWDARPFVQYDRVAGRDMTRTEVTTRAYLKPHSNMVMAMSVCAGRMKDQPGIVSYELGGTSGLRGWPAFWLSGNEKLLIQSELRLIGPEVFHFFVPGAVLFWDGGDIDFGRGDFVWDVGVGLRLGLTKVFKFPNMRFDAGWPYGQGRVVYSFGTSQAF
ncbi:MAG: hypothetical protein ABIN58_04845 [candidate division WOR-3 bacterium]